LNALTLMISYLAASKEIEEQF